MSFHIVHVVCEFVCVYVLYYSLCGCIQCMSSCLFVKGEGVGLFTCRKQ